MDRADVAALESNQIAARLAGGALDGWWRKLEDHASENASHLLQLVCRLDPPERIFELRDLETEQSERGAGFLGMLPDQIPDDLEPPKDLEASLDLSIRLARIRIANLEALSETMPQYPLSFSGNAFDPDPVGNVPDGWRLDVDVDGIRAALGFLDAGVPDIARAGAIARMPAFVEMLRHRRDLGYVPEPLIDEDGLAWCLIRAVSRDPIDELWRWLHPQNLFDLSDLNAHRAEYRLLTDGLTRDGGMENYILGSIAPYAPPGIAFADRLSFAIGWGINGWATQATGGANIEHAKDDFDRLLPTLVHETFHRLQISIAFPSPEIDEPGFGRITSYPFEPEQDRRLYQALCYVMLEGSATWVASRELSDSWKDDAKAGIDLLERIRSIEPSDEAGDECDALLGEGLRSNGPFYGFGALLSHVVAEDAGPSGLGDALQRGAPLFVERGLALLGNAGPALPDDLTRHVARLRAALERAA